MNILHLTPDFNYTDGRSYYVYLLLKYFRKNNHNVFLITNGGDSFDRLDDIGINYEAIKNFSSKISFIKSANFLSEFVKKNDIEIIHSHHRYHELLANAVSKKSKIKPKTVFTALSIVEKKYSIEYRSDLILAVSKSVQNILKERFNVSSRKTVLIPNFVDSEEIRDIQFKKTSGKSDIGITNILGVGRFHKEKNFRTLLEAVSLLKDKKIKVVLVGEGEEKERYLSYANSNSLNFEIYPPQKDLKEFYDKSDICVLPSLRDPFPGFMLQSGLHGKAFIGTDTDGISELIKNEENGLLFKKRKAADLAGKINIFIEDKSMADKCAERLHKTIINNYTEKQIIPEIEGQYHKLIG